MGNDRRAAFSAGYTFFCQGQPAGEMRHAPTLAATQEEKEQFYDKLSHATNAVPFKQCQSRQGLQGLEQDSWPPWNW